MKPYSLQTILLCLFSIGSGHSTAKERNDIFGYLASLTSDPLTVPATVPPGAIASPTGTGKYCFENKPCPELSGQSIATVFGPHYAPDGNRQVLLDIAKSISTMEASWWAEPTCVGKSCHHTTKPTPFTTTLSNWEVLECESSTVLSGRWFHLRETSCAGSRKTITSPRPLMTMRMDATPCNWGSAQSTDVYTSVSSALMEVCSSSMIPTVVVRSPKPIGTVTPKPYTTTMSACNTKAMTISNIMGPVDKMDGRYEATTGDVIIMADKNIFEPANVEMFINASARAVAASVAKNAHNMEFIRYMDWDQQMAPERYVQSISSSNSTELNYYEAAFTEYTQVFIVEYTWEKETTNTNNKVCEHVEEFLGLVLAEVPELEEIGQFAMILCDVIVGNKGVTDALGSFVG